MPHFELYTDASGEFRWRFRAANGKVVADSGEGYRNRADCERGIEILKTEAAAAAVQDLTQSKA